MSQPIEHNRLLKIVIVGDGRTGKTSYCNRFSDRGFSQGYTSTIGVDFCTRTIADQGSTTFTKIQLWDTSGIERFRSITNAYYRGGHGIMLFFAVNNRESFQHVQRWYQTAREHNLNAAMILIGTHSDMPRVVGEEEIKVYAQTRGLDYIQVSAKNNTNILQAMQLLSRKIPEGATPTNRNQTLRRPMESEGPMHSSTSGEESIKKVEYFAPILVLGLLLLALYFKLI